MASSRQTFCTYITCGINKLCTEKLNDQSNINQIHEEVRRLFGPHLPGLYCLTVYNPTIKKIITLNQNQLDYEFNPFKSNQYTGGYVELCVIDTMDEVLKNDTQSNIYRTISNNSSDLSSAGITYAKSQEDLPISNTAVNDGGCHGAILSGALLNKDVIGTDTTLIVDNNVDINELSFDAWSNENQSDLEFPFNGVIDPDIQKLIDTISIQTPAVQLGNAMPSLNPNFNISQTSIEKNTESTRLQLTHDVKPIQKVTYRSDQINQKDETKTNGYIPRVQGIKNPGEKMSAVWPKVRIPRWARNIPNIDLLVYVVSERMQNGIRCWIKHRDKGFLPNGFTRDTPSINPMVFHLDPNVLPFNGDFKLDLQMPTMWDKSQTVAQIVYQLDEQSTIRLHPAIHDPSSPRLLCVLAQDGHVNWETFCLSDFIRSTKQSKRCLPAQINQSACKRARAK